MKQIEINKKQPYYRFFEILPGLTTWSIFIFSIILSIYYPKVFATVIIIYAIIWLMRALSMSLRLIVGYKQYRKDITKDWHALCQKNNYLDLYHLVIVPSCKESYETLKYTFDALTNSLYPLDKLIVVLAPEERTKEFDRPIAQKIQEEFGDKFYHFEIIEHPGDLPGEVKGKGANITYAAEQITKKFINSKKIPYENIVVTSLDSDHRPHKQYFSALTYTYKTVPNPIHKSFQPIPMFFNNIWDVPILIRSIALGSSFWQIIESTKPYRLRNFAAHSQPLAALVETNYWSKLTIVEDGHQYWRSYFHFDGNYDVIPLNIPIYQDATLSNNGYVHTFIEQYLQKKRWAWGASDIAYVATNMLKNKKIPALEKFLQFFRLFEGHISWATTSIVLFFAGWLPFIFSNSFDNTVVAFNFPYVYSKILTVAMVGMVITLTISTLTLPPRPKKSLNWSIVSEWIITPFLLPFSNIILSSFPSIHAQTMLMFGKYMDVFRVTDKKAVNYQLNEKSNERN